MGNANLKQWLIEPLNNQFWREFLEVLGEEFDYLRGNLIYPLENFFNFYNLSSNDYLLNITPHFGYIPDLSINSSLSYLKREIESIGFRKKFKTTYLGYEYLYKSINYNGQIFSLFYDGEKLIRASLDTNLTNILALPMYDESYLWLAEKDFSTFFNEPINYDTPLITINYDEKNAFYDIIFQKIATKHIAPEYFIDRVLTINSNDYLMTNTYLEYLANGVEYNRRTVEVPHTGCQLGAFMDLSGLYDNLSGDENASIPSLKLKASIIPFNFDYNNFNPTKIKIGTGTQSLISSISGGVYPTDLVNTIFEEDIVLNEYAIDVDLAYLQTIIEIKYIENEILTSSLTTSIIITLNKKYLRRLDCKIIYEISSIVYEAYDDGNGNIIGDYISSGTIDYDTGDINLTFSTTTSGTTYCSYIYNSIYRESDSRYENIEITEAGIFNASDDLLAYMTFPPVEYNPNKYHLGFQFIILNQSEPAISIPVISGIGLYGESVYSA